METAHSDRHFSAHGPQGLVFISFGPGSFRNKGKKSGAHSRVGTDIVAICS